MRLRLMGVGLVVASLLVGCPQERRVATGGGGGQAAPDAEAPAAMHSRHYRDDLGEAFLAASRAHEALVSGDPPAARRHSEEVRQRLSAGKERAWLAEQRTLLRLEDQAILLQSDLGTGHPDALSRSKQLLDALSAAQVNAASLRPPAARPRPNAVRPGLGDAGALALRAHDYLGRGEQAQALSEVKALRRRLKEARQYAAGEQVKRLAVLDVEANQLEYMVRQNSPKALRAAQIMARHLGMAPRLASQGGGGGAGQPVVVGDPQYYPDPGARRHWTGDGSRRNGWADD